MSDFETRTYSVTRADLVAYAAASGDHNPIHQDEEIARSVGLPGVIAHGMFTLALVARYLGECGVATGDVSELGGKFVKPVVVPAEGAEVTMTGHEPMQRRHDRLRTEERSRTRVPDRFPQGTSPSPAA